MGERFETLYKLKNNLYKEGAPIIISACVLLKDTQTNNVITQIKFQSVSDEIIQAVKISLNAFDVAEKPITGVEEYQYLDLKIKNGEFFGHNKAIIMPNRVVRSIKVDKIIVIFKNCKKCEIAGSELNSIDSFEKLDVALENSDLVKQYQIDLSRNGIYVPQKVKNLWICPCGTINSSDTCTSCNLNKATVFSSYDISILKEHLKLRLAAEKKEQIKQEELARIKEKEEAERLQRMREQFEKDEAEQKKRKIIYSIIAGIAIILMIILSVVISYNQKKNAIANIDLCISEHQYERAFDKLNQSNLSKVEKQEYLEKLIPLMKSQRNTVSNTDSQALNIDNLIIQYDDNCLYYIDENDEKKIVYEMSDYEKKENRKIQKEFMYANGYIFFVETKSTKNLYGAWESDDYIKYVNLKTGSEKILESYCDFSAFYKLQDGRIVIDLIYSDIVFNPYKNTTEEGKDIVSEEEKDDSIYSSK